MPPATGVADIVRHLTLKMAKYEQPHFIESMKFSRSAFFWMTAYYSNDHKLNHEKECLFLPPMSTLQPSLNGRPAFFKHEYKKWWKQWFSVQESKRICTWDCHQSSHPLKNMHRHWLPSCRAFTADPWTLPAVRKQQAFLHPSSWNSSAGRTNTSLNSVWAEE